MFPRKLTRDPQEHETEYGTHWNFFFTMGTLPVLEVLLHPVLPFAPVSMIAIAIALCGCSARHGFSRTDTCFIAHQVALSAAGWREFVIFAPRTDLLSANKEGIVSLFGYLAIHLLGLSTGTMILPPSPSYFRRQQLETLNARSRRDSNAGLTVQSGTSPQREDDKTATELAAYAILWWTFLGLSSFLASVAGVSRRLVGPIIWSSSPDIQRLGQANLPYILWVAAFNTSFILAYFLLDLFFFPSPLSKSIYSPTSKLKVPKGSRKFPTETQTPLLKDAPALLQATNQNSLSVFLLVSESVIPEGRKLTGITGECGDWLRQPGVPYHVHERHVCDGDPECLFCWHLPICMGGEGPETLETIEYWTNVQLRLSCVIKRQTKIVGAAIGNRRQFAPRRGEASLVLFQRLTASQPTARQTKTSSPFRNDDDGLLRAS